MHGFDGGVLSLPQNRNTLQRERQQLADVLLLIVQFPPNCVACFRVNHVGPGGVMALLLVVYVSMLYFLARSCPPQNRRRGFFLYYRDVCIRSRVVL